MAKAFGAVPVHMNVALTSYLLSLAVFIPASGWVADRYGARTVFRAAIAVFTLGSILCGRADSLAFLVAARVLQGIGGAMMVPVGRLVLLRTAAKQELVAAMAWLTVPALLGPVLGPPVGGFIVTYFSWRWIFDINIPIGILGIVLVSLFVEDVREPPRGRFDGIGLLLCGVALASLMFGLETAGRGVVPRDHRDDDRHWPRRHRRLSAARAEPSRAAAGSVADAAAVLRRRAVGDDAVPHRHRRHPVPAADDAAGGLRQFGGAERVDHLRQFRRRAGDEAGDTARAAAVRLPRHAGVERVDLGGDDRDLCGVPSDLAGGGDLRRTADRRLLPFAAVHRLQHARLRRRAAIAHELGDQPLCHCQQLAATIGISAGAVSLEISMAMSGHAVPQPIDFSHAFLVVAMFTLVAAPIALLDAAQCRRRNDRTAIGAGAAGARHSGLARNQRLADPSGHRLRSCRGRRRALACRWPWGRKPCFGRGSHLSGCLDDEAVRVIGVREATRAERTRYEEEA